jgi:hypothetical protein
MGQSGGRIEINNPEKSLSKYGAPYTHADFYLLEILGRVFVSYPKSGGWDATEFRENEVPIDHDGECFRR